MKKLSILFLLTLSLNLHANEEACEQTTVSDKADKLASDSFDAAGKVLSCAQQAVDPDKMKKRIEGLFQFSEDNKDKIINNWDRTFKKTVYSQLFRHNGNEKVEPLMDWLTHNGEVAGIDKAEKKQAVIDQYVAYAKKFDCTPRIEQRNTKISYPENYETESEVELKKLMKAPDFKTKKNENIKPMIAKKAARTIFSICNGNSANTHKYQHVAVVYPPCAGNLSGFFKDNEWKSSSMDLNGPDTSEVVACIKASLAKGAVIDHIAVVSSANALSNTELAAKKFGEKGFLGLSQARAESARDTILPQIFSKAGVAKSEYESKVGLHPEGANGDGTSGPCPYKLVKGEEVRKDEFKTPEGSSSPMLMLNFSRLNLPISSLTLILKL